MNNIRVLQIGMYNKRGGIESFLINYYKNIDKNKIQFDFINMYKKLAYHDEIIALGGKIYNITNVKKNPIKYLLDIRDIIFNNGYDIIHINMLSAANILPIVASKLAKAKIIIVHSHNSDLPKGILRALLNNINKNLLKFIVTDYFACSNLAGEWMFKDKNFIVVKNAIDAKKFLYNKNLRDKLRKKLNLDDKFVIGNVSRFSNQKNHTFLIDVFKQVYEKNPNTMLLLVGDGELKTEIKHKLVKLGLINNVIFTGEVVNTNDYLQVMDVFVFPSLFEGLGISLVEAQASGLYCIISDTIPKETIITNLVTSMQLCKPSRWAKEILKYSSGYDRKDMYNEINIAGYDIKKASKNLENIYIRKTNKKLIGGNI